MLVQDAPMPASSSHLASTHRSKGSLIRSRQLQQYKIPSARLPRSIFSRSKRTALRRRQSVKIAGCFSPWPRHFANALSSRSLRPKCCRCYVWLIRGFSDSYVGNKCRKNKTNRRTRAGAEGQKKIIGACGRGPQAAGGIAADRRDLDYVGAEVGEDQARGRAHDGMTEFERVGRPAAGRLGVGASVIATDLAVPSRLVPQEPAGITAPMVRPVPKRFGVTARR
jgi:hypothetical protein